MNFSTFKETLSRYRPVDIVFIGLGNDLRRDDGVARQFITRLARRPEFAQAHFFYAGCTPENYLEAVLKCQPAAVVFIDAVLGDRTPGTIDWVSDEEIADAGISTHSYSLRLLVQYLTMQRDLSCYFLGITPLTVALGSGISVELEAALDNFFQC